MDACASTRQARFAGEGYGVITDKDRRHSCRRQRRDAGSCHNEDEWQDIRRDKARRVP